MKNQYIGDVCDYIKYGILRMLPFNDIRLGVNWYHTLDDESNDGNKKRYLLDESYRTYDDQLYNKLKDIECHERKSINMIENNNIFPHDTLFYNEILDLKTFNEKTGKEKERNRWHMQAMTNLHGSNVVFFDPDTGTEVKRPSCFSNEGVRYVAYNELTDYLTAGFSCVVFKYRAHKTEEKVRDEYTKNLKNLKVANIKLFVIATGINTKEGHTSIDFLVYMQPEHEIYLKKWADGLLNSNWKNKVKII